MLTISGYSLTAQLYESTNSLIYRGYRLSDEQPVVLKMLKDTYPNPERIAWFKREYEVTRNLTIPGVVDAYEILHDSERLVIVLEDFGGDSLALLGVVGQLELSQFLKLAIAITEILDQIHAAHIIHKDINPSNIVLNPSTNQVKIIDFGISTVLSQENPTWKNPNVLEGTLAYISPEQTGRMNRAIDYRTDFYSLGVTFYELLIGTLPFQSSDALESVHNHIAKQPIPPHELKPELPPIISDIVLKLMAKNAEDRYQSAYGLMADLETCLHQLQTEGQISSFSLGQQDISYRFQIPQKLYGREQEIETLLAAFERVAIDTETDVGANVANNCEDEPLNFQQNHPSKNFSDQTITSLQNRTRSSRSEILLVAGYSGVGKSTLVREVHKLITIKKGRFVSGKFDQYQRNIPYYAISQAFNDFCNYLLTENEATLNKWKEKIQIVVRNNGQVLIDVIPNLERVIGSQPPVAKVGPQEAQNRFNLVFKNFIKAICKAEHPLVLFIDDLQWADGASLKLLRTIMSDVSIQYLLIIGAYRDNEVDATHPLMMTLEDIKKEQGILSFIQLDNLRSQNVNALIADALDYPPTLTQPLTDLVFSKTQGNAFFTTEFLKSLNTEGLLSFDKQSRKWQWNLAQIQAKDITDNVVELIAGKIGRLAAKTQAILKLAACIGNRFDLSTLEIIYQHQLHEVFTNLFPALQEGLIVPLESPHELIEVVDSSTYIKNFTFKFIHDRVQQAAYSLIDDSQKQAVHLQIGRLLLQNSQPETLLEKIFEIVDHLNVGVELITAQTERDEIAKLNLMAGQKAKVATAYGAALGYFIRGIELLAIDSWQNQYDLTLNLYIEAVEAAYITTDFEQMEKWATIVLQEAKTVLDKVKVFEVKIQTCMAQVKQLEGIKIGLQTLNLLGVNIPESPTQLDIQRGLEETATALKGKNIEDLINLPLMTDTNTLAAMRILSSMLAAAYIAAPVLWPLIGCKQVNLSIRYGNAPFSPFAYVTYGTLLVGITQDIDSGYQFGQLALSLVERLNAKEIKSKIFYAVATFTKPWKAHLRETLPLFQEAYSSGIENGDLEYIGFTVIDKSLYSYFIGSELTELEREMATFSNVLVQIKQEMSLNYHQIFQQAVLNLIGRAENPCRLVGEVCNEEKLLPLFLAANIRTGLHFFYTHKLILCYLFGEFYQAVENATKAEQYVDGAVAILSVPILYFYDSLVRLAVYPSVPSVSVSEASSERVAATKSLQEHLLLKVTNNQKLMQNWAHHAPMNHLHKFYLVEAEKARVLGQVVEAIDFYERAIKGARENQYLQEEALAYELAAKFYLARGMEEFAQLYMTKAHYSYVCWGAKAKVKDLEQRYPQFFTQRSSSPAKTSTTTSSTDSKTSAEFDLTSVIKASQTLSGEIMLDTLLGKMMKLVIENAGAQKGYLILEKDGQWLIEASGTIASDEVQILQSIPIESVSGSSDTPMVANAIVNYVIRTQESVVLNDASHEGNFTRAPYILKQQPKSVLCAPLIHQGKLTGILYLENNLTTGAFTSDRLEVLNVLSSQAAIAIENAKLYAEVRDSEAKLTQFLEALPVGVSVHDATGKVSYANPTSTRLMGKGVMPEATPEQLAQVYQVYIEGTDQPYPTEQLPTLRALKGESVTVEDIEVHREGEIIPLEVRSIPVFDDKGNIIYAINAFQDITERKQAQKVLADYNRTLEQQVQERTLELEKEIVERKRAEEAANVANQAKSTFLANMSHELRSPLNAILGFSQLMSRTPTLTPEDKENLRIIARSGEHLLTLINQVLDLSKIEAGRITLNETSFDLYQLLDDLEDMFHLKADDKQLQLLFDCTPDVPRYMRTDEVKLRQVLINLLTNAIKFTQEGGVSVRVSAVNSRKQHITDNGQLTIHFEIEDTGAGIAPDELDSIFESFVQSKTGQQVQEGTGLGLPITRSFVQLMGGEITVSSQMGRGTVFKFDIQASLVDAKDIKTKQPMRRRVIALEPNQPQYRILIVDDNWDNRQLLIRLLNPLGFELREATNGQEAIEVWKTFNPHLIWMDMRMPVMDGYEATKQIRNSEVQRMSALADRGAIAYQQGEAQDETSYGSHSQQKNSAHQIDNPRHPSKIIALTASTLEEERFVALEAGCDDFIRKPFRETEIFGAMHKHIAVRYVYDELTDEPDLTPTKTLALTEADLDALPADWAANFHQATIDCDLDLMMTLIAQICDQNESLANALADLVNKFQFEKLLSLTQSKLD